MNKKAIAFSLFDKGKTPSSPEIKELKLKGGTRYTYFDDWKNKEIFPGANKPLVESKGKVRSELEMVTPSTDKETKEEEEETNENEKETEVEGGGKAKVVGRKSEGKGNGQKGPPGMVAGQGLTFAITISTKTLMLYQIAAGKEEELTLGDFIDTCVEDTYRGRGFDLGLVKIAGEVK